MAFERHEHVRPICGLIKDVPQKETAGFGPAVHIQVIG